MTGQEQGYWEYGVRCPDGRVRDQPHSARRRANASAKNLDNVHGRACKGPHVVVKRKVGPWVEAGRG